MGDLQGLPASNRGVSQSERIRVSIDALAFTVDLLTALNATGWQASDAHILRGIESGEYAHQVAKRLAGHFFGQGFTVADEVGKGRFYTYRVRLLDEDGRQAGLVEFGGLHTLRENGRYTARLEILGTGCRLFDSVSAGLPHSERWGRLAELIGAADGRLTRVDIAADDFEGQYPLEWAESAYDSGQFKRRGQNPEASLHDDKGSRKGRTLYIGSRKSERILRCYEKGKEQGDPNSPWMRYEAQFTGSSRSVLPLEILIECSSYLKGAYPVLAFVDGIQKRISIVKREVLASCSRAIRVFRTQYGPFANALLHASEGCEIRLFQFISNLARSKVPKFITARRFSDFGEALLC